MSDEKENAFFANECRVKNTDNRRLRLTSSTTGLDTATLEVKRGVWRYYISGKASVSLEWPNLVELSHAAPAPAFSVIVLHVFRCCANTTLKLPFPARHHVSAIKDPRVNWAVLLVSCVRLKVSPISFH